MSSEQRRLIAIIEDEPALAENYRMALHKAGYDTQCFSDAQSAWAAFNRNPNSTDLPDLALIDIGLGNDSEGGFTLCRQLRSLSATLPILFLTARDSELDVISGLRLGADDYLIKDISLLHLIARINALFRRNDALLNVDQIGERVQHGELVLDSERLNAQWRAQDVSLTVTEFWLVHSLAQRPGQVKSRQQLMESANVVLDDQTITAHIKRIRRKFSNIDAQFDCIQTVYGMGYRWVDLHDRSGASRFAQ